MKKIVSALFCCLVVSCFIGMASAALDLKDVQDYAVGSQAVGQLTESKPTNIYEFRLSSSGKIQITYSAVIKRCALKLYDAKGKEIWTNDPWSDASSQQISLQENIELLAGTYYFSVAKNNGYGPYNFRIDHTNASESLTESQTADNNSLNAADGIAFAKQYNGQIALNDTVDHYKFTLSKAGKVKINYNSPIKTSTVKVLDAAGKEVWANSPVCADTATKASVTDELDLTAGTYYVSVSKHTGYGNYNFRVDYSAMTETFVETQGGSNNTTKNSELAGINLQYSGQIALNDEADVYRFSLATPKKIKVVFSGGMKVASLKIVDSTGKTVWTNAPKSNATNKISFSGEVSLAAGTYYFSITRNMGYGSYVFFLSDGGKITVVKDPITVLLNGQKILFDQLPIIENGRTLVPVRAIFEALNATVSWDNATKTVTSQKGNITIKMTIGNKTMYKNGNAVALDTPPRIVNTRTLVPVRAVAEAYGCTVNWDNATRTVIIMS